MGGYSTAIQPGDSSVYPQDWDDLYAQPPRPLAPGVPPASMNSAASSYGFQPDADPYQDNPWYRTPLPDGAMSPDLSSSGASGSGQTSQPQANMVTGPPSSAAGQLLSDGAKEPPPQVNAMPQGPPTMPARMPPPGTVDPDSGLIIRGPDPNAIAARQAQQSMPPLSAAVQAAAQRIAGGPPKMTSNWAQRLSMAVLSLGKLAPYAMQITHPQWTQQMNAYQQDEKDLGTLSTAQETQQRGAWYQAQAEGEKNKPIVGKDGAIYVFNRQSGQYQPLEPAQSPLDRKNQALQVFGPGHDDEVNAYALNMKPEDMGKTTEVPWSGLTPELQSLYSAGSNGKVRVPTSMIEKTLPASTGANAPLRPDEISQANQLFSMRYAQLNKGPTPQAMQLTPGSTLQDLQTVEKNVSGIEGSQGANDAKRQSLALQSQLAAQHQQDEESKRSDTSYQFNIGELNKESAPIEALGLRMGRLQDTIAQNSPMAQSLVAPELLTVMAGGQGSGMRMNEAEIQRIVGGRNAWQGLQAAVQKYQLDPTKPFLLPPEQINQTKALVNAVSQKLAAKIALINISRQSMLAPTNTPIDHRRIVADTHTGLAAIDAGGSAVAQRVLENTSSQTAQGGYIVGHKYNGITYLGGDPKQGASWKQ